LKGAHLSATGTLALGAHSQVSVDAHGTELGSVKGTVITSFSGAKIDIDLGSQLSASNVTLNSLVDGTLAADATDANFKIVVIIGNAEPEVLIRGGSSVTATGQITAFAKSDVIIDAITSPDL